jgi:hypothetical protein
MDISVNRVTIGETENINISILMEDGYSQKLYKQPWKRGTDRI